MPRRSAADLSIVPLLPGKGRPEPPKALDQIEARAWNDVIDALPDRWLDPAGQLVLRRTVTQVAIAERLEERLRRLSEMEDDPEALEAEKTIAAMHRETAKAVLLGLTALGRRRGAAWPRAKAGTASNAGREPCGRGISWPRRAMARPRKQPPPSGPVTAADVIAFIETVCFVPEGKLVGQPLKLQAWQKDILCAIYDNPHGTRRAIISMGRKNAKTTLSACLLLAHLCGPPARNRPNSELYSAAQSRDQAAIIFSLAAKMVRLKPDAGANECASWKPPRRSPALSLGRAIGRFRPRRRRLSVCRRA